MPYHTTSYHIIPYHTIVPGAAYILGRLIWEHASETGAHPVRKAPWNLLLLEKEEGLATPALHDYFFKMVMILELAFCRKTCPNLIIYAETLYFLKFNSRDGWKPIRDRKKAKSKESRKTEEKSKASAFMFAFRIWRVSFQLIRNCNNRGK